MRSCPNCKNSENVLKITEGDFLIVECRECGLTYLLNPPDEKVIYEEYYRIEFKGSDYKSDSGYAHLREIYEINKQRTDYIQKLSKSKEEYRILDIGCGSGLFLKSCREAGLEAEGMDVSNNALDFARNEFGLTVYRETVDDLIAEGKKYSLVTMWHVLEHIIEPAEELRKIKELLTQDGIVLIEVPNLNSIKFRLSGHKWKGGNHPLYHRSFFTSKTLKDTIKRGGFGWQERIKLTYRLSNKSLIYNTTKSIFNIFGADAFLNFVAGENSL